jgi:xylulose-5-phosphate/fructose-6-phosphate phosphoketolase
MGRFLRDVMKLNMEKRNFRLFSPDENNSNRWQDALEVTNRAWVAETYPWDDHLAPDGRVMEMLSEHQCQGWLEGYLLTGRHGFFSCYEAFIHIIDSMFNQHAKWLKVCNHIPWRRPIASLNYLLSSHVWRQDHNGFSHQDPGFIDHVVNKKAEVVRVYLPPDANCLLSVTDHCLRSRNYVNVVVAGKQPAPQWLTMDEAIKHCEAGVSIWEWASNDRGGEPDVVMACCGDVPTLETLAAVDMLRRYTPELKVRVINVVNLMTLQPASDHPHGLSDHEFDALFTTDKPIIFAFHGYPWLIHRLTYRKRPREHSRARLQGGGHHDHTLRHVRAQRSRSLPSGQRRRRPGAEASGARRLCEAGDPQQAHRPQAVHRPQRRRHARDHRLEVGAGSGIRGRPFDGGRQRLTLRRGT